MKTLYELLNVTTNADKQDIKRAFHRLAKQHHPDLSSDSSMFLKILDAYETLIDDKKRKIYNTIQLYEQVKKSPILPKNRVSYAVSLQDLVDMRCFNRKTNGRRSGHFKPKGYDVCVYLTRSEIKNGSVVKIDLPAHVICPSCGGNRVHCSLCSHKGHILKAVTVPVPIPRGLGDGEIFYLPLRRLRQKEYTYFMIENLYIKIKLFQEHIHGI
jgi:DnaJ-class molecular chaperone